MFELPELTVIAAQMNDVLPGLTVAGGALGHSPHRFVWYDRTPEEFAALTAGLRARPAWVEGKWLFLPLEPGYVLLLGEWGGRIRYHAPRRGPPREASPRPHVHDGRGAVGDDADVGRRAPQ